MYMYTVIQKRDTGVIFVNENDYHFVHENWN